MPSEVYTAERLDEIAFQLLIAYKDILEISNKVRASGATHVIIDDGQISSRHLPAIHIWIEKATEKTTTLTSQAEESLRRESRKKYLEERKFKIAAIKKSRQNAP